MTAFQTPLYKKKKTVPALLFRRADQGWANACCRTRVRVTPTRITIALQTFQVATTLALTVLVNMVRLTWRRICEYKRKYGTY